MDLEEFVSESILGIIRGIESAGNTLKDKRIGLYSEGGSNQRHVEFDVAVSASDKNTDSKGAGGKIKVWEIFNVGADTKRMLENTNSTVSRIKFGVRVR